MRLKRAIGFTIIALVLISATSGIARRDAQDAAITAAIEREVFERKSDVRPEMLLPVAHDAMTWQVVNGEVQARFYCSSRCRREVQKRALR